MTNLQSMKLDEDYSSITHDVYNDFFNKILKGTKRYYRYGGPFSSKSLASCAEGLQEFIHKDGKMRLILTSNFSEEDIIAIKQGMSEDEVISKKWITDLSEIKDKFVEDHTKALAWMISNNYLEIKIIVPTSNRGEIIPANSFRKFNLLENQVGIFWGDENRDAVSFLGKIDLEDSYWGEYYEIRIHRSWEPGESKYVDNDLKQFNKFWDGDEFLKEEGSQFKTIELPDAVKQKLIQIAPKSKSEIILSKLPTLRRYQKTAVENWRKNNKKGIFEMATGTGKTITAIGCIKEIENVEDRFLLVIVCPTDNLMRQWSAELEKWAIKSMITPATSKWALTLKDKVHLLQLSTKKGFYSVITSYNTFCSSKFTKIIQNCKIPIMVIADEVHHVGSPEFSKGLIENYKYRLGLTATLERHFDENGTQKIVNYFGDTVFEKDLEQAIKEKLLVPYYYFPLYVDLTEEEYFGYIAETRKIAVYFDSKDPEKIKACQRALNRRYKIIRDAENKIPEFEKQIKKLNDVKYCLIFCSEKQMHSVKNILNRTTPRAIINREITDKNPSKKEDRNKILRDLADGRIQAIVANMVLDEGADIPEANLCILLASTGNPKQFIQRRGRVLRPFFGTYKDGSKKEFATIYDLLIMPKISPNFTHDEIRIEKGIVRSQIERQEMMGSIAINSVECMKEIKRIKEKFGLV